MIVILEMQKLYHGKNIYYVKQEQVIVLWFKDEDLNFIKDFYLKQKSYKDEEFYFRYLDLLDNILIQQEQNTQQKQRKHILEQKIFVNNQLQKI